MNGAAALSARLALMLTELRVPTIKRVAADICQQSDKEGWPGQRLLEALIEHRYCREVTTPRCGNGRTTRTTLKR